MKMQFILYQLVNKVEAMKFEYIELRNIKPRKSKKGEKDKNIEQFWAVDIVGAEHCATCSPSSNSYALRTLLWNVIQRNGQPERNVLNLSIGEILSCPSFILQQLLSYGSVRTPSSRRSFLIRELGVYVLISSTATSFISLLQRFLIKEKTKSRKKDINGLAFS